METIYWFLIGLGILVYFMNELQNHIQKKENPLSSPPLQEHFLPIQDSSIHLPPYAHKQATTTGWLADAPATVLANTPAYKNNMQGGIFGTTPPFLYVQAQSLIEKAASFPYDVSDQHMSVATIQSAGLLPPTYRQARGNGRVRQTRQLYQDE